MLVNMMSLRHTVDKIYLNRLLNYQQQFCKKKIENIFVIIVVEHTLDI